MRIARLRHRLVIEYRAGGSPQRSATGAVIMSWIELATVWGSLETLSGRRLEAAQATWPEATGESLIRYRADVASTDLAKTPMRISYGGRYYAVGKAIDGDGERKALKLLWKEGASRG